MYFKRPVLVVEYRGDDTSEELLWVFYSTEEEHAKKQVSESNMSKRERYREWFNEYKSNFRCVVCKENSPETLQFHHVDPAEKKRPIPEMVKNCVMLFNLENELEKCIVLCSNCHNNNVHLLTIRLSTFINSSSACRDHSIFLPAASSNHSTL